MAHSLARANVLEIAPRPQLSGNSGQLALALTAVEGPNLSEGDRAEALRRFGIIEPLLNREKYSILYAQYPRRGDMIGWLVKQFQVKKSTIYLWLQQWEQKGIDGLAPKERSDKGKPRIFNNAAMELLLRAATPQEGVYGVLSVAEIFRLYEEERIWREANVGKKLSDFGQEKYARYADEDGRLRAEALLPKASYETFRLWFDRIPEVARVMAREGGEAYRNSQEILSHREISAVEPMEYVVMDHRRLDIFCLLPERGGWKLGRPWLTAAIDMRTRKWLGWVVVESPSSDSIAAVLKQVFLQHGVPKSCYWDNGKDFRCEWLEGVHTKGEDRGRIAELDTAWRGVMGTLGIRVHHAIVKNARAKLIEPNFGRIGDFDRTLPEWCGHKPGARPEVFAELLKQHEQWAAGEREATPFRTIYQVADLYNRAIEDLNERPLQGEGMNKVTPSGRGWMCPNEAWEILIRRVERKSIALDVLQFCFSKRKELTVQHGEIQTTFDGRLFRYRIRGNHRELMLLNGRKVELAYDPLDLGNAVVYCDSRLVGLAECVALRRMGEDGFVEDEQLRRASRREVKKFLQAVQTVPIATPDERLDRRRAVTPSREEPQRPVASVTVPVEIAAAAEMAREDAAFRFADAPASEVEAVTKPAEDEGFDFFR